MIVDSHVNIDSERYPVESVLEVLSAANIQSAVVFADARAADIEKQNAYVLEAARRYNLYPFYYIGGNPFTDTRPDPLALPDNLEEYTGVRWHRWTGAGVDLQGIPDRGELDWAIHLMESAEFEAFVSAAVHYNLPVMFEESFQVTLELVSRFPSLDLIIPHLGARNGGESNILRAFWDAPNVYFDTSLAPLSEDTLSRIVPQRIFFGSGYPEGDPDVELDRIDRLPVPDAIKEGIFGENLLSFLAREELE